jgi:hypothetical protein
MNISRMMLHCATAPLALCTFLPMTAHAGRSARRGGGKRTGGGLLVVAWNLSEKLLDVPLSVTAIQADALTRASVTGCEDQEVVMRTGDHKIAA